MHASPRLPARSAIPHPFRIEHSSTSRETTLVFSYRMNASSEQAAVALRIILSVISDESTTHEGASDVQLADALHLAGDGSQYSISVTGPTPFLERIWRRYLNAPQLLDRATMSTPCALQSVGDIRKDRFYFAESDKDMPLATVINTPDLAGLLARRIAAGWPPLHSASDCQETAEP